MSAFNPLLSFDQQQRVYDAYIEAAFNKGPSFYEQNRANNHAQSQLVNTYFNSFGQSSNGYSPSASNKTNFSSSCWSSTSIF